MIKFLVMGLGVWRMSRMFYDLEEDGPFDILHLLRMKAGVRHGNGLLGADSSYGRAMICPYCISWWVGLLFTVLHFISPKLAFIVALPFALSGVVVLMYEHVDPDLPAPDGYPPPRLLD